MILLLDYDGTLVPIADHPDDAKMDPRRKSQLVELSKKNTLAIITGRSFESFKKVFGDIPESIYVITSHGVSLYKGERLIERFATVEIPNIEPLRRELSSLEGAMLEEKEGCFAVHYRNVGSEKDEEKVKKLFWDFVQKYRPKRVIEGKKVIEAVYGGFDKGTAVHNFLKFIKWDGREPIVYIGDDTTDRYALKVVKELGGKAVFVGREKPPEADGLLSGVEDVYDFLSRL